MRAEPLANNAKRVCTHTHRRLYVVYLLICTAFQPATAYPQVLNSKNSQELFKITDSRYYAKSVYFTVDDKSVAITNKLAGEIEVFDTNGWSIKKTIECNGRPGICAISKDGLTAAIGMKGGILLMNTAPPCKSRGLAIPNLLAVDKILFDSTSENACVVIIKDVSLPNTFKAVASIVRLDLDTGKLVSEFRLPVDYVVDDIANDCATATLRGGFNDTLRLYDIKNNNEIKNLNTSGFSKFSNDGAIVSIYSSTSRSELSSSNGRVVNNIAFKNRLTLPASRSGFDVVSSGKLLVYASGERGRSNIAVIADARTGTTLNTIKCYNDGDDIVGVQVNRCGTIFCTTRAIDDHRDRYIGPSIKFWKLP